MAGIQQQPGMQGAIGKMNRDDDEDDSSSSSDDSGK